MLDKMLISPYPPEELETTGWGGVSRDVQVHGLWWNPRVSPRFLQQRVITGERGRSRLLYGVRVEYPMEMRVASTAIVMEELSAEGAAG